MKTIIQRTCDYVQTMHKLSELLTKAFINSMRCFIVPCVHVPGTDMTNNVDQLSFNCKNINNLFVSTVSEILAKSAPKLPQSS